MLNDKHEHEIEWRGRIFRWFASRVNADDRQAALDIIGAGLAQARIEGVVDAAEIVEDIAAKQTGDRKRTLDIIASSLRDYAKRDKALAVAALSTRSEE